MSRGRIAVAVAVLVLVALGVLLAVGAATRGHPAATSSPGSTAAGPATPTVAFGGSPTPAPSAGNLSVPALAASVPTTTVDCTSSDTLSITPASLNVGDCGSFGFVRFIVPAHTPLAAIATAPNGTSFTWVDPSNRTRSGTLCSGLTSSSFLGSAWTGPTIHRPPAGKVFVVFDVRPQGQPVENETQHERCATMGA